MGIRLAEDYHTEYLTHSHEESTNNNDINRRRFIRSSLGLLGLSLAGPLALEGCAGRWARHRRPHKTKYNTVAHKMLDIELEQQAAMLKELEKIPGNSTACHDEVITAPRDGVIQAVTRELHEVVKRGEPILSFIADDATVLAETYIDDDEIAALEKGKVVSIVLPDNTHTNGVIKSVKSSAAMHAERVLDHYVPIKSRLFVMMEPKTSVDADLWKQHDRMNIYVSIRK